MTSSPDQVCRRTARDPAGPTGGLLPNKRCNVNRVLQNALKAMTTAGSILATRWLSKKGGGTFLSPNTEDRGTGMSPLPWRLCVDWKRILLSSQHFASCWRLVCSLLLGLLPGRRTQGCQSIDSAILASSSTRGGRPNCPFRAKRVTQRCIEQYSFPLKKIEGSPLLLPDCHWMRLIPL